MVLPYLPHLLQDLESLGGMPEEMVAALREVEMPEGTQVLDLGCVLRRHGDLR